MDSSSIDKVCFNKQFIYVNINNELHQTDHPDVKCTKLPDFWRIKKSLHEKFRVYFQNQVCQDGTKVIVRAGNKKYPSAEIKNNETVVLNGVAEFSDLRFISTSGRGKSIDLYFFKLILF